MPSGEPSQEPSGEPSRALSPASSGERLQAASRAWSRDSSQAPPRSTTLFALARSPRLRPVVRASITLGFAVGVFAVSFGVGAVSAGASTLQTCAMSLLVFTGASQFSAVSVIAAGGSTGSALGGALLLAARNGVYGLAMSRHLDGSVGTRLIAAQLTIDESTAMALAQQDEPARRAAFWITGLSVYLFWNIGTLVGALLGNAINPATFGLDAAFPAAFVVMLWPHLRSRRGRIAAALGVIICISMIPFVPVGVPILCASLAVLVGVPAPTAEEQAPTPGTGLAA